MEDELQWKMNSNGRGTPMEDELQWKMNPKWKKWNNSLTTVLGDQTDDHSISVSQYPLVGYYTYLKYKLS